MSNKEIIAEMEKKINIASAVKQFYFNRLRNLYANSKNTGL
jgi:hypothetical protein